MKMGVMITLLLTAVTVLIHELGHAYIAVKCNNYKGWGLFPMPHIKLRKPFITRLAWFSGIIASIPIIPVWIIFFYYTPQNLVYGSLLWSTIISTIAVVSIGGLDIYVCLKNYKELK